MEMVPAGFWSEDVNNIQEDNKGKGDEIYPRVSRSDIGTLLFLLLNFILFVAIKFFQFVILH